MTATNGMPRADAYLNCLSPTFLPSSIGDFRIELHAQPGLAQLGREREIEIGAVGEPLHHHHVGRRRHDRFREHVALAHHDEDALEAERDAAGGNVLAGKHADQVVVAAAATEAAGEIGHANLEDRPRVVRQPAREAAIERQVRPGAGALAEREDLPQILNPGLAFVIEDRGLLIHPLREIRRRRAGQLFQQRRRDAVGEPLLSQLLANAVDANLVGLVHDDQGRAVQLRRHAGVRQHRIQQLAVIDDDLEVLEAKLQQHVGGRRQDLCLDGHRRRADRVDVALIELAEAALLRPVGAPHRLNLVALEELRQLRPILGDDARERHGHVVAQAPGRPARSRRPRRA